MKARSSLNSQREVFPLDDISMMFKEILAYFGIAYVKEKN